MGNLWGMGHNKDTSGLTVSHFLIPYQIFTKIDRKNQKSTFLSFYSWIIDPCRGVSSPPAPNKASPPGSTSSTCLAKKLNVSRSDFTAMRQDPDSARLQHQAEQPDVYKQLLQWSRTEDLSRIAKCRAVFHSGFDKDGTPVVVYVGKNFPVHLPEHKVQIRFRMTK